MKTKLLQKSIVNQLIISQTLAISFVSIIISIIIGFSLANYGKSKLHNEADLTINHLAKILEQPLWSLDDSRISSIAKTYEHNSNIISIEITDISKQPLFLSIKSDINNGIKKQKDIILKGNKLGNVKLIFSRDEYIKNTTLTVFAIIISNLLILITVFFVSKALIKTFFKSPLDKLTNLVTEYSKGNYKVPLDNIYSNEFQSFADTLIKMGTTIEEQLLQTHHKNKELRRLFTAIEQIDEGIIIADSKGIIQFCNPAFESMTQYSKDEIIGFSTNILKSGEQNSDYYSNLWNTINTGDKWTGSFINKKKDGSLYHEESTISPIMLADGSVSNFVSIKRDVTSEIEIQSRLNQSQKMEAIGTLAGGVAHDFNNILGGIMGYLELLQKQTNGNVIASEYINEALSASDRAAGLIKQILTFARKSDSKVEVLILSDVVKEAIKLIRATLPTTIEINEFIKSNSKVKADSTQIHQIIMNLCTNAKYAMSNGGILDINLTETKIEEAFTFENTPIEPGNYIQLTISDNGTGMSKEIKSRIFEPFFTSKNVGEGTGMGLSVVHGIIKDSGGFITVYSEEGIGTSFKIFLPIFLESTKNNIIEENIIDAGTENILFVDDEEILVKVNTLTLEDLGYTVTGFTNSLEALKKFKEDPSAFDIVISDTTMPDLPGDELAKKIKELSPNTPFILCSGFSENVNKEIAFSVGADSFLSKPIDKYKLSAAIRKALDNRIIV